MKKRLILPILAILLLLCACGGTGTGKDTYAVSDAKALLDAGVFSGEMEQVDSATAVMVYGIDSATVKDCACYMASNTSVNADEVTVLVLTDEAAAKDAAAACQDRVDSQIDSCTDYCPDQVPRLEDAVIDQKGNTVLLAVGDPDKLPQAIEALGVR